MTRKRKRATVKHYTKHKKKPKKTPEQHKTQLKLDVLRYFGKVSRS